MLNISFTQVSQAINLFHAYPIIFSSALDLRLFKIFFQHDFARMIYEADSSVVLAML